MGEHKKYQSQPLNSKVNFDILKGVNLKLHVFPPTSFLQVSLSLVSIFRVLNNITIIFFIQMSINKWGKTIIFSDTFLILQNVIYA